MILDITPFRQSYGMCGAACMKIIMDYWGIEKSEKHWALLTACKIDYDSMTVDPESGCHEYSIIGVARAMGFKGAVFTDGTIDDLKEYIKRGIPAMVLWTSPEEGGHFSVVAGIARDDIFLADPHFGEIKQHEIVWFEKRWREEDIIKSYTVWYR